LEESNEKKKAINKDNLIIKNITLRKTKNRKP